MSVIKDFALRFVIHVGVDRRRDDRAVTEKGLDEAKVDPLLQEHGGDGVPEYVRRDFLKASGLGVTSQRHPDRLLGKASAEAIGKEKRVGGTRWPLTSDKRDERRSHLQITDGNQTFLIALTANQDRAPFKVDHRNTKVGNLGDPHSGGEKQFEQGHIPNSQIMRPIRFPLNMRSSINLLKECLQAREAHRPRQDSSEANIEPDAACRI